MARWREVISDAKVCERIATELKAGSQMYEKLKGGVTQGVLSFMTECGLRRINSGIVVLCLRAVLEGIWQSSAEMSSNRSSTTSRTSSMVLGTPPVTNTDVKDGKKKRPVKKKQKGKTPKKGVKSSDDKVAEKWSETGRKAWGIIPGVIRGKISELATKLDYDLEDLVCHYVEDFKSWEEFFQFYSAGGGNYDFPGSSSSGNYDFPAG
jgi:hypothetical protein